MASAVRLVQGVTLSRFPRDASLPAGCRLHQGRVVPDIQLLTGVRRPADQERQREEILAKVRKRDLTRLADLLRRPGCVAHSHSWAIRPGSKGVWRIAPRGFRQSFDDLVFLRAELTEFNLNELLDDPTWEITSATLVAFRDGTPKLGAVRTVIDRVLQARSGETPADNQPQGMSLIEVIRHPELWCSPTVQSTLIAGRDSSELARLYLEGMITQADINKLHAQNFVDDEFMAELARLKDMWLDTTTSGSLFDPRELIAMFERESAQVGTGAHRAR